MKVRFAKIFVILFVLVAVSILFIAVGIYKIAHPSASEKSDIPTYITKHSESAENSNNGFLSGDDLDLPRDFGEVHFTPNYNDLRFSLNLLQQSIRSAGDNIVISPVSFYTTAVLLANGAEGKSLAELKKMLLLADNDDLQMVNRNLEIYLDRASANTQIHHVIWADKPTAEYRNETKTLAETESRPRYTNKINEWTARKTAGRISELLPNRRTDSGELFIINTASFKNNQDDPLNCWEKPFSEIYTSKEPFYSSDSSKPSKVFMMHQTTANIGYYEDEKMQAVKLYYLNGNNIQIFLPKKGIDFATFIRKLTPADLDIEYAPQTVEVSLPRFKISKIFNTTETKELFKQSGADGIFRNLNRDFEYLSHKEKSAATVFLIADIKIDEKGQDFEKSTPQRSFWAEVLYAFAYADKNKKNNEANIEVILPDCCAEILPEADFVFKADHPFVFMINNGLFIGAYVKGDMQ